MPSLTEASRADPFHALVPHSPAEPIPGAARGPLAGLAFTAKDLFAVKGVKLSNGNADFHALAEPEQVNAAAVQALLDAGATLTGVTIPDEFFYSLLGTNAHYGNPINPRAADRVTGGSSCGAVASLAGGYCDFALASDTGGSVRVPAAFTGLYGLRPTHGRISMQGGTPMAPSYDTAGFFASDPQLLRKIGHVLLDEDAVPAAVTRMVLADDLFAIADPKVAHAVRNALMRLGRRLPPPERVSLAEGRLAEWREAFRLIQASELQRTMLPVIRKFGLGLGPGIKQRFEAAERVTAEEALAAQESRKAIRARLRQIAAPGTLIALPTTPTLPPLAGEPDGPAHDDFRARTMEFTCPAGHAGLPQIAIPAGEVDSCPVGLSFIGWEGGDEALLELAAALAAGNER